MRNVVALYDAPDTPSALTRPLVLAPVAGDSMQGAGLYDGDLLIVDRSLEPKHADIVIALLNGGLTVKRLVTQGPLVQLRPANPRYSIITVTADQELLIWGVVTGSIRQFHR